jgi:hypothetical protein
METGMRKMFICEHQVVPNLSREMQQEIHSSGREEVEVLYSFSNIDEKCMYSVIKSPDRLSIEAFFSERRIPCDSIMEVEAFFEGKGLVDDWKQAA